MSQLHGENFIISVENILVYPLCTYLYLHLIFGRYFARKILGRKGPLVHLLCLKENEKGFNCYLLVGNKYLLSRTISLVSKGKRKGWRRPHCFKLLLSFTTTAAIL